MNARIPPLTLQLLTENAIKHNVVSRSRPLKVVVSNDKENIIVTNNLQAKKQAEPSTGLGLKNIKERYLLISRKSIKLETSEDSFKVYLPIIPVS
jgi:LytS/YehU family sensor histidine kinase